MWAIYAIWAGAFAIRFPVVRHLLTHPLRPFLMSDFIISRASMSDFYWFIILVNYNLETYLHYNKIYKYVFIINTSILQLKISIFKYY